MSFDRTLQGVWYQRSPILLFLVLTPLSLLFGCLAGLRRALFRYGVFRSFHVERPVIVIGNISVGGTGKTPLVIWIAQFLLSHGFKVGVVTRGYGGNASTWPQVVGSDSSSALVGDESVLIANRTHAIVVAGPDRVAAARMAIDRGAEVILSDDGLQHYRLARDAELVVLDAERQIGNGWLLPAGPLREGKARLTHADLSVATWRTAPSGQASIRASIDARYSVQYAQCLADGETRHLASFVGSPVHAIAGIGNPDAFFAMLRERGLSIEAHPLPDHAPIAASDLNFPGSTPILMTEKDGVKCRAFATRRHWVVPLDVAISESDQAQLAALLLRIANAKPHITHADR